METTRITLRIPKDLWEKLKKEASENNRSLNSEIVYRLNLTDKKSPASLGGRGSQG